MQTGIRFHQSALVYGCSKKDEKMKDWIVFSNTILEYETSCISRSYKKKYSFLSNIANKLQAMQFSQNCFSEKAPGSKKFVFSISYI